ncbi:hypothetical protein DXG01_003950 [Tephrocybe rancida]|nr:hypothetical protein DXG01_003950 [Tephrocybe rancida]
MPAVVPSSLPQLAQPIFPLELIDIVVSNWRVPEDHKTLAVCSTVSPEFRKACQKVIFHSIHLTITSPSNYKSSNLKLYDLLIENPSLQTYVRCLQLTIGGDDPVASTLEMFTQLRELSLAITHRHIPEPLVASVEQLVQLPTLEALTVRSKIPSRLLMLCGIGVKRLSLENYQNLAPLEAWETSMDTDTMHAKATIYLDSLVISHPPAIQTFIVSIARRTNQFSLDQLRSFKISIKPHTEELCIALAKVIFRISADWLEQVTIRITGSKPWTTQFTLESLPHLKYLKLILSRQSLVPLLCTACEILQTIPDTNVVREITFVLSDGPVSGHDDVGDWEQADGILMHEGRFKELRRVSVHFLDDDPLGLTEKDAKSIIGEVPRLLAQGLFFVHV